MEKQRKKKKMRGLVSFKKSETILHIILLKKHEK
jgi:hypothetical protein